MRWRAGCSAAHERGEEFRIGRWSGASTAPGTVSWRRHAAGGASTAPEVDGVLASEHGIDKRLPYNSDPTLRALINAGEVDYVDTHLSRSAQHMWFGFHGNLDVAVVEVAAILPTGCSCPAS